MVNIIAEIGINFGGDINVARNLILQASRSGCWGVKFQFRNVDTFYFVDNEIGDAIIKSEKLALRFLLIPTYKTSGDECRAKTRD